MTDGDTEKRPGQIILGWWSSELGARETGAQKALSARLRRGDDITVLCQPAVNDLAQRLSRYDGARPLSPGDGPRIARLARVLAHVRDHQSASLPHLLGRGDPRALSPLRFERLVQSEGAELEAALRRALRMVRHTANVAHLGEAILFWSDWTRTRWCFDYYGGGALLSETSKETSQ